MTITLSSNAQSNQGTVTAAQYDRRGMGEYTLGRFNLNENPIIARSFRVSYAWNDPAYSAADLQNLPGATTWEARKGIYSILKLNKAAFAWHDALSVNEHYLTTGVTPAFV